MSSSEVLKEITEEINKNPEQFRPIMHSVFKINSKLQNLQSGGRRKTRKRRKKRKNKKKKKSRKSRKSKKSRKSRKKYTRR